MRTFQQVIRLYEKNENLLSLKFCINNLIIYFACTYGAGTPCDNDNNEDDIDQPKRTTKRGHTVPTYIYTHTHAHTHTYSFTACTTRFALYEISTVLANADGYDL